MFNQRDEIELEQLKPEVKILVENAIFYAVDIRSTRLTIVEVLAVLCLIDTSQSPYNKLDIESQKNLSDIKNIIRGNFNVGITEETFTETISNLSIRDTNNSMINYFSKECMSQNLIEIFDDIACKTMGVIEFMLKMFKSIDVMDDEIKYILTMLVDIEKIKRTCDNILSSSEKDDIYNEIGELKESLFSEKVYKNITTSIERAFELGFDKLNTYHVLLSILEDGDSLGANAIRICLPINISFASVSQRLEAILNKSNVNLKNDLPIKKSEHSSKFKLVINEAQNKSIQEGEEKISEKSFLTALFEVDNDLITRSLKGFVDISGSAIIEQINILSKKGSEEIVLPLKICSCSLVMSQEVKFMGRDKEVDQIFKIFYRKEKRNILLYGDRGVGKTAMANAIAQSIENTSFLKDKKVIYFNASEIRENELMYKCQDLFDYMEENQNRVYVVDGFYRLMKNCGDICKRNLTKNKFSFIGIVNAKEQVDLTAGNDLLNEYFQCIEIEELPINECTTIIEHTMDKLGKEYSLTFEKDLAERIIKLSADFIISKRFPQKSIELISVVCSNVSFEATKHIDSRDLVVSKEDVADEISRITGMPKEVILGTGKDVNFKSVLKKGIMGQDRAVEMVADRLDSIQKGMGDKKMPRAIFLFVGLSGTGKTELAKEIAKVYSSSRKLIVYPMQNFKEAHNVSGILGTSVGYKGYEDGGKLINDLNRDPYSVFLFDEIEKAHPEIWDAFLQLFDEGEIRDLTGNVAYGNKSFFVLTSNIGYQKICKMLKANKNINEIEEAVLSELYSATHRNGTQLCFRPEFIGRILQSGGLIVFNPLTQEAMTSITGKMIHNTIKEWNASRDSKLVVEQQVLDYIGEKCFQINEHDLQIVYNTDSYAGNNQPVQYKGGRIIHSMINEKIIKHLTKNMAEYAKVIEVRVKLVDDEIVIECFTDEVEYKNIKKAKIDNLRNEINQIKEEINKELSEKLSYFNEEQVTDIYEKIFDVKRFLDK